MPILILVFKLIFMQLFRYHMVICCKNLAADFSYFEVLKFSFDETFPSDFIFCSSWFGYWFLLIFGSLLTMFWRFTDSISVNWPFFLSHNASWANLLLGRESLNFIPLAASQLAQMLPNNSTSYSQNLVLSDELRRENSELQRIDASSSLTYVYLALLTQHWALYAKVDFTPRFIYIYIYRESASRVLHGTVLNTLKQSGINIFFLVYTL